MSQEIYDPRLSRRITATLFAAQSFEYAAFFATFTLIALVAKDLSGKESMAGIPSTVVTFSRALFAFPLGMMMDRLGRRNSIAAMYLAGALAGVFGVMAIQGDSFAVLLIASIFWGLARGGIDQSRFVAAEVYPREHRANIISTIVFAGTFSAIAGTLMVVPLGNLAVEMGIERHAGTWVAAIGLSLLAMLLTFIFLRPDPRDIGREIEERLSTISLKAIDIRNRPMKEIFGTAEVQVALGAMLISQTVMQMLMTITSLHMRHHGHSDGNIATMTLSHTVGMFVFANVTGYLINRYGQVRVILAGAIILIGSFVLAPLSVELPVVLAALFLVGLGWNLCFVGGSSLLANALSASERARAQGVNETLVAVGAGFGSLSSGIIFDYGNYVAVSAAGLILTLVLTGILGLYRGDSAEVVAEQAA